MYETTLNGINYVEADTIKEKEITLDGQDQEKYHFHIRQLEKLIGGQK